MAGVVKIMKIVALDLHTLFPEADDENCLQVNEQEIKKLCGPDDELICCRNLDLNHCGTEENISRKVAEAIADADVVITNKVKLNKSNLNAGIKLILVAATGTNNINFTDTEALGIRVQNSVAYGVNSVVQHTIGLMLSLINNITVADRHVRNGDWSRSANFCICRYFFQLELAHSTIGIIGGGAIGRGVAKAAAALGMKVLLAERRGAGTVREGRTAFDDVIRNSDVISLHCPLTPDTENLISERELSMMKKNSYLINVARGGVVDEQALYRALKEHRIAGAATDVLSEEPPKDNILLSGLDNLIVTPHIAWGSYNARSEIIRQMAEHIAELKKQN